MAGKKLNTKQRTELSIGDYGSMIFEIMIGVQEYPGDLPPHWASIQAEATPLVRQLLALNEKMSGGGYAVYGYVEPSNGERKSQKSKLSETQRIDLAQQNLWLVTADKCKEGDLIWLCENSDYEMYIQENDPLAVVEVTANSVYVDHPHERHGTFRLTKNQTVFKAPSDYSEKSDIYQSKEYWLNQADLLGI